MAKKTSERGIKLIAIREGEILYGYKDSKGLLTVGVGHLVKSGEPYKLRQPITLAESRRLLAIDLKEAEDAVNSLGIELLQNEFDALVSLTFNIGVGGFKRSSVAKRLKAHAPRQSVAQAILLWNKPKEIQRRRRTEYDQFLTPYPNSATSQPTQQPSQLAAESDKSNSTTSDTADTTLPTPPSDPQIIRQTVTEKEGEPDEVATTMAPADGRVIEKEPENLPFWQKIYKKVAGWLTYFGGAEAMQRYKADLDSWGIPTNFIKYLFLGGIIAFTIWLIYEALDYFVAPILRRWRTNALIQANTTATNTVMVASSDKLDELEKAGWTVIRRK